MKRFLPRLTYANVVATLALFLVLTGGAAYAATKLAKNSVGTKQIQKGAVTPAKLSAPSKAALTGSKGATGATGATGAQGPEGVPGAKGEAGESATALWAEVEATGTLMKASGTTGSKKRGTGEFEVDFNRDVTGCTYQATIALSHGEITAEPRTGVPDGVLVETFSSTGTLTSQRFSLAVFC